MIFLPSLIRLQTAKPIKNVSLPFLIVWVLKHKLNINQRILPAASSRKSTASQVKKKKTIKIITVVVILVIIIVCIGVGSSSAFVFKRVLTWYDRNSFESS